ncbi:MAG TPA: hypothetical protein VNO30_14895 [Kofleriaceae bacterium]|nr:hypothetical protein [Kofleriaceae bacterium]
MRHARVSRAALALAVVLAAVAASPPARAEHDHGDHGGHGDQGGHGGHGAAGAEAALGVTVTAGALAASYHSRLYDGSYEGARAGAAFARGRYEVGAELAGYRIVRNGRAGHGLGDLHVHGSAMLVARGALSAGVHLMVMAPTGDDRLGVGMGHVMLMPAAWSAYAAGRARASVMLGYGRGIGDEGVHAEHGGSWPLVDPMGFSELTLDAAAAFAFARAWTAGVALHGALPLSAGDTRLLAGARVSWRAGRVDTAGELQAGVVGDPVRVRGLLSTSLRF